MFEKYKIKRFLQKINGETNLDTLLTNYSDLTESLKKNKEICNALFTQNSAILKYLPLEYQLEIIEVLSREENPEKKGKMCYSSKEAQTAYIKEHFSEEELSSVYGDLDYANDIIAEIIISNPQLINNFSTGHSAIVRLQDISSEEDIKKILFDGKVSIEIKEDFIKRNNKLFLLMDLEFKMNFFLKVFSMARLNKDIPLKYWNLLSDTEKDIAFLDMINKIKHDKNFSDEDYTLFCKKAFSTLSNESQKEFALKHLDYLQLASREVQLELFNMDKQLIGFLSKDVVYEVVNKDFSNLYYSRPSKGYLVGDYNPQNFIVEFNDMSNPMFSAKGTLLHNDGDNGTYDTYITINQYAPQQISNFQNMNVEALANLCQYDVNYILPFVAIKDSNQLNSTKENVKKIFELLYGEEKLSLYTNIIDFIFNNYKYDYEINPRCILDSLKIIFNKDIIMRNDVNLIREYIKTSVDKIDSQLFSMILSNAYGAHVEGILKSRENLNEHTINSLELLNPLILETFGIGLVHDLMSYNITNQSYLVALTKDLSRFKLFSKLFRLEAHIFGENIETFQRTLNDFPNFENLLISIGDNELSPQESEILYQVITNRNFGKITNKSELSNYEVIVKNRLVEETKTITDISYIKEKICRALFGIPFNQFFDYERTNYHADKISRMYNMANVDKHPLLNQNEKIMINFLNYLVQENNKDNLMNLLSSILIQNNIIGNPDFHSGIIKMKNHAETLLNDNLITVEKLEEELKKENPLVIKIFKGEVPVYILNGIDFGILAHNLGGTNNTFIKTDTQGSKSVKAFNNLEEQYGSSTISTHYWSNISFVDRKTDLSLNPNLLVAFNQIPQNSLVAMQQYGNSNDASTEHASKLISSRGGAYFDANNLFDISIARDTHGPEVAFYRRNRDESLITNDNSGGRIRINSFTGTICTDNLSHIQEDLMLSFPTGWYEYGVENNVPIILVNTYAYSKAKELDLHVTQGVTL